MRKPVTLIAFFVVMAVGFTALSAKRRNDQELGWRPVVGEKVMEWKVFPRHIEFQDIDGVVKAAQVRCAKTTIKDNHVYVLKFTTFSQPDYVAACL